MRQQINLYQPTSPKSRGAFSAASVAAGLSLLLAGLAAFTWNEHRHVRNLEGQAASLRATQTERQADFVRASGANVGETPEQIDLRVKQLEERIAERRRALQMLRSGGAGRTTGFAQRLDALARRHVEGLWLDQIVISGTDGAMSLRGIASGPDVVSQYLRSLAGDSALSGARFDDFLIERPEKRAIATPQENAVPGDGWRATAGSIRFRAASESLQQISGSES